jgi:hypothetical protein
VRSIESNRHIVTDPLNQSTLSSFLPPTTGAGPIGRTMAASAPSLAGLDVKLPPAAAAGDNNKENEAAAEPAVEEETPLVRALRKRIADLEAEVVQLKKRPKKAAVAAAVPAAAAAVAARKRTPEQKLKLFEKWAKAIEQAALHQRFDKKKLGEETRVLVVTEEAPMSPGEFQDLFGAGTLLPPVRGDKPSSMHLGRLLPTVIHPFTHPVPFHGGVCVNRPTNPNATPAHMPQNPKDKRKTPTTVMSFPTYEAANALFGGSLKKKIVISTWWLKVGWGAYKPPPVQDFFCEGQITKVEAHFNPGKNEVAIHTFCQSLESSILLFYKPPRGYRSAAAKK